MRKLGKGQAVIFCIPREIELKIRQCGKLKDDDPIQPIHVLRWAISETCNDMRRSLPLWASQGQRFERQRVLWDQTRRNGGFDFGPDHARKFMEDEAQSLDSRYSPHSVSRSDLMPSDASENAHVARIMERCVEFESFGFSSATLQEEQERELSPENEREQQVERPPAAKPREHNLHRDLHMLARTGELNEYSPAFMPAFMSLRFCSAAEHFDVSQFPTDILVTIDFAYTIKASNEDSGSDSYLQPVQWLISTTTSASPTTVKRLIVISPFEAQQLLPTIQSHRKITLHIYSPRVNLSFRSLSSLDLFTIGRPFGPKNVPRRLVILLDLFAGQLYLDSFADYVELCGILGLAWRPSDGDSEGAVAADGFVGPVPGGFRQSPVKFLRSLFTKIRRNCETIGKTHMGRILDGGLLTEGDFVTEWDEGVE